MERNIEDIIYTKIVNTYLYYRCKSSLEVLERLKENDWDISLLDSNNNNFEFLLNVNNKKFKIVTSDIPTPNIKFIKEIIL